MQGKLLHDVQFIYELYLAKLEIDALCNSGITLNEDFKTFEIHDDSIDVSVLTKRFAYVESVNDVDCDYYHLRKCNQTKSFNQYLTHWFYPYKGKFHPQMIRALINIIKLRPGDVLFDPFIGSGTTALEAQLLGISCYGLDINLLCTILAKVKTQSVEVLEQIRQDKDFYLHKGTLFEDSNLKLSDDERVQNFYKIAEMIATSDESRRNKNFADAFGVNVTKMMVSLEHYQQVIETYNLTLGDSKIEQGDIRKIQLQPNSVDGIITSPPYHMALDYLKNDKHALDALNVNVADLRDNFIGIRGRIKERVAFYNFDMQKAYQQMYRALKPGKYCVIIIGNAIHNGEEIDASGDAIRYCKNIGFSLVYKIDKIIYGMYNQMKKEYILIFQKPIL